MKKAIIHVNKHVIASNLKHGKKNPAITRKIGKQNDYGKQVDILDKEGNVVASVIQPNYQLSCGGRIWITCHYGTKVYRRCKMNKKCKGACKT